MEDMKSKMTFYKSTANFNLFNFIGGPRFLRSVSCIEHDTSPILDSYSGSSRVLRRALSSRPLPPSASSSTPPPPPPGDDNNEGDFVLHIKTDGSHCKMLLTHYGSVLIHTSEYVILEARAYAKPKAELKYSSEKESSDEGEAFALDKAMSIISGMDLSGYDRIQFLCDNKSVVDQVNSLRPPRRSSILVAEITALRTKLDAIRIQAAGKEVELIHRMRDYNTVADAMASYVREAAAALVVYGHDSKPSYSTHPSWGVGGCAVDFTVEEIIGAMPAEMKAIYEKNCKFVFFYLQLFSFIVHLITNFFL